MTILDTSSKEALASGLERIEYIHSNLEVPNWAPWLAFSLENLVDHSMVYPEGQFDISDEVGVPIGVLSANRINWSGDADELPHWDDVAGEGVSYRDTYQHYGNALSFMSMSVDPNTKGQRVSSRLVDQAIEYAKHDGIEHIIGDFRPSDFGSYKRDTQRFDFGEYSKLQRADGQLYDGWLRAISRRGMVPLKVDHRAMVANASRTEFEGYMESYRPEDWWQVDDPEVIDYLLDWYEISLDLDNVDEVWECGEAGTWFVDNNAGEAVYVESNLWGEIPFDSGQEIALNEALQFSYDYHMTPNEFIRTQSSIIEEVEYLSDGLPGVYGVWIGQDTPYANAIRSLEEQTKEFKGIEAVVTDEVEQRSVFFALVDTRAGANRIIHATRLSGSVFQDGEAKGINEANSTGFIAIDELTETDQGFTADDFYRFYESIGVDLTKCVGVETNFTVGERSESGVPGLRVSDLGYIAIFNQLVEAGLEVDRSSVFAFVNSKTENSLAAVGVVMEPLVGRADLRAPSLEGGLTDDFRPVRIPLDQATVDRFTEMSVLGVPEFDLRG